MTRRAASLLLALATLLALTALPVAAQDEATPQPLPTPPAYEDGALVQLDKFFSPTCGHCHYVITETLPPIYEEHGGTPVTTYDQTIPPEDVAYYLMSNGQLQILFVDTTSVEGQAMFRADSVRLDIDSPGVPRVDIEGSYLTGSIDIPEQLPDIVADGLAGDGIGWPDVPGLADALTPFIEMGAVPELELAVGETPDA
jgi:hypothetical protein